MATANGAIFNPAAGSEKAVPKGYKVQYVGHSFHVFVPTVMASLAKEAGISGHKSLGMDMLPASYPCQHWNKNPNTGHRRRGKSPWNQLVKNHSRATTSRGATSATRVRRQGISRYLTKTESLRIADTPRP